VCPAGYYGESQGLATCTQCAAGQGTQNTGSTQNSQCDNCGAMYTGEDAPGDEDADDCCGTRKWTNEHYPKVGTDYHGGHCPATTTEDKSNSGPVCSKEKCSYSCSDSCMSGYYRTWQKAYDMWSPNGCPGFECRLYCSSNSPSCGTCGTNQKTIVNGVCVLRGCAPNC